MKKLILMLSFIGFLANIVIAQETKDYSLAKAGEKVNGVYIFVLCEPAQEYEYIATVDVKMTWDGTLEENFEKAIKKAQKKHPYFNALIFQKKDMSKADLIKFTDIDISKGGVSLGSKVSFIESKKMKVGEVVELKNVTAAIKLPNGEIKRLEYKRLTPISDEKYLELVQE
jgi:hypothetical protein